MRISVEQRTVHNLIEINNGEEYEEEKENTLQGKEIILIELLGEKKMDTWITMCSPTNRYHNDIYIRRKYLRAITAE